MAATECANCGTALAGRFCVKCGQDADAYRRPISALLSDAVDQFFGLDSRVVRTLTLLVAKPGELTRSYIAGHRQPYIPALRLYLFITVVFFVALSLAGIAILQLLPYRPGIDPPASYVEVSNDKAGRLGARVLWFRPFEHVTLSDQQRAGIQKLRENLESQGNVASAVEGNRIVRVIASANEDSVAFNGKVQTWIGRYLLLMMPLFALMTAVLLPSRFLIVDHLTFALHFHSFLFIALLAAALIASFVAPGSWLAFTWVVLLSVYLFLSLRRAYGLNFVGALWRTVLLFGIYVAAVIYGLQETLFFVLSA